MDERRFDPPDRSSSAAARPDEMLFVEGQERALAQLMAGMDEGVRWVLLLGPKGIGKSTVLRRLLGELEPTGADVVVCDGSQAVGRDELVDVLRYQLRLPRLKAGILRRARPVADLLASRRARGKPLVVLVDNADVLSPPSLRLLAELAAGASATDPELFVVLVGTPAIEQPALRAWSREAGQRRAVQCRLAPFTAAEVRQYLEHRMRAGAEGSLPFSEAALKRMVTATNGVPGLIDALCEEATVHPSARLTSHVSADLVDEAAEELGLTGGPTLAAHQSVLPRGMEAGEREDDRPAEDRPGRRLGRRSVALAGAVVAAGLLAYLGPSLLRASLDWLAVGSRAPEVAPSTAGPQGAIPPRSEGSRRDAASTGTGRAARGAVTALAPGRQGGEPRPGAPARSERAKAAGSVEKGPSSAAPTPEDVAALMAGARDGRVAALTRLLAGGVSPNARDADGFTPLMLAVAHGQGPAARALLDGGAQINARGRGGITPLMLAVINERPEALTLLLERGADVNAQSGTGWTALTFAAWKGDPDLVRALLSHGANPRTVDKQGWTPLQYAAWRLRSPGGPPSSAAGQAESGSGPLADSERGRHSEVVPLLQPGEGH